MTIAEMIVSDKAVLIPKDIAPVLQCDPYTISLMARDCPERLGFPVCRVGTRTKIPRIPFLKWLGVIDSSYSDILNKLTLGDNKFEEDN